MSQEIVYTSAPKGLKAGSRGFCTVASTSGMAVNLAERLESLSGYRHAYLPHEDKASLNPVNYSHQTVTVGGRKYHVLSRICNAGLDYTQRSNKLAHHVALDQREAMAAPGGPAWVLQDKDFCVTQWSGDPRHLPSGRAPRTDDCPQGKCVTWAKATGDAGWAGVLAESLEKNAGRPMSIIFKPETDTLQLLVEAISLLPVEKRWNVTFSTYCTNAASDAQWRFLLEGTDEATKIQRNPHTPKIDLTQNLGRAEGGELVELARQGGARPSPPRPSSGNKIARRVAPGARPQAPGFADASELVEMPAPPPDGGRPPAPDGRKKGFAEPPVQDPLGIGLSKPKKNPKRLVLFGVVAALLVVGLALGAFMLGQGSNKTDDSDEFVKEALAEKKKEEQDKAAKADQKERQNNRNNANGNVNGNDPTTRNGNPDQDVTTSNDNGDDQEVKQSTYQPPTLQQPPDQTVVAGNEFSLKIVANKGTENGDLRYTLLPPSPQRAAIDSEKGMLTWKPQSDDFAKDHEFAVQVADGSRPDQKDVKNFQVTVNVPDPFVDIRAKNLSFELPTPNRSGLPSDNKPKELAKLYAKARDLRLELLATDLSKEEGFEVRFERDEGNAPKWTLWQTKEKTSRSSSTATVFGNTPKAVASFELDGQSLTFQWEKERSAISLAACLLRITVKDKAETCVLTKPQKAEPVRIDFADDSATAEAGISNFVELDIQDNDLPRREMLRLDLQLDGFPQNSFKGERLKVNESVNIRFGTRKEKIPILELVVILRWRESDPKPNLVIKPLAFPTILSPDGTKAAILPLPLTGDPKLAKRKKSDGFVNPSYLMEECEKHIADVKKRGEAYEKAIGELNKQRKPVVDRLAEIDGVAKKLERLEKQLKTENKEKEKKKLNDQINETFLSLQQLNKEIPGLLNQKQEIEKELAEKWTFLNQGKIAGENLEYAEQLSKVMEGVSKGAIHFRAYFDIDVKDAKKQVVVVETAKSGAGS